MNILVDSSGSRMGETLDRLTVDRRGTDCRDSLEGVRRPNLERSQLIVGRAETSFVSLIQTRNDHEV